MYPQFQIPTNLIYTYQLSTNNRMKLLRLLKPSCQRWRPCRFASTTAKEELRLRTESEIGGGVLFNGKNLANQIKEKVLKVKLYG